jgi:hypothetical protein
LGAASAIARTLKRAGHSAASGTSAAGATARAADFFGEFDELERITEQ